MAIGLTIALSYAAYFGLEYVLETGEKEVEIRLVVETT